MTEFFLTVINMSISASWIVLAVVLLRLLLKKAPKWITVLLWGIVAVRLICPFTIESVVSLIPSAETISPEIMMDTTPEIHSGIPILNNTINPVISESFTPDPAASANPLQILIPVLSIVWLVGIVAMLAYTAISYFKVTRKIGTAVLLRDNIFQSENVGSPFVLGIAKPKIYLPFNMHKQDMSHVIAHEQAHIRRKDHWWKPFGFLLLALHWFNPLMWLGYVLLCRDIELACDEKVIQELNPEQKADYSQALLTCSVNRRVITACPLAFGEVGVKNRVKSVLNYKKPAFWIVTIAIAASIVAAVCFLTNPINSTDAVLNKLIKLEDYEVIEQNQKKITLTISLSDLPDSIYSETGTEFKNNEIVAYKDATTSIYLTKAMYSNESNDNLYFCFDFDFDLPKKQGALLYPYEITNNGFSCSVRTADGSLTADNGVFSDAVNDRGQGSGNLIWFYVSTDALKRSQGTIHFDVLLNEITYFLDGDDYSSISNVGGADDPDNVTVDPSKRPPTLTVSCGNISVNAWLGSYSWSYKNLDDGTAQAIIADASHPLSMLDRVPTLSIVPSTLSHVEPRLAVLQFANAPDKIEVICYAADEKDTEKGEAISVKDMTFQMKEGSHLYEIIAEWTDTEGSSGKAYYAFQTFESHMNTDDTNLTSAVSSVLKEKYQAEKPDGLIHIENYHLLANKTVSGTPLKGNTGHINEASVYLLVYYMKYSVNGGQLEEVEGDFVPTAITFTIDENGGYTLKEYWTPQAGANYEQDVRSKFPEEAADNALNTEKYAEALIAESWRLANNYLSQTQSSSN